MFLFVICWIVVVSVVLFFVVVLKMFCIFVMCNVWCEYLLWCLVMIMCCCIRCLFVISVSRLSLLIFGSVSLKSFSVVGCWCNVFNVLVLVWYVVIFVVGYVLWVSWWRILVVSMFYLMMMMCEEGGSGWFGVWVDDILLEVGDGMVWSVFNVVFGCVGVEMMMLGLFEYKYWCFRYFFIYIVVGLFDLDWEFLL